MRGLYRYLSPFSPDQSGAVSVLYELGGLIVVLDAGGCAGNVCGFDEPRWLHTKSAVFSAGLRDMDAILGRDDRLLGKLGDAIEATSPAFVALVGTPVPAVIATDYQALCHTVERRFGLPAVYVPTTGMDFYERGELKAYEAVVSLVDRGRRDLGNAANTPAAALVAHLSYEEGETEGGVPDVGVWGATPLSLPAPDSARAIRARLAARGLSSVTYGMGGGLRDFLHAYGTRKLLAVSPAGHAIAERIAATNGAELETGFAFGDEPDDVFSTSLDSLASELPLGGRVLVVHQQVLADEIRAGLEGRVEGPVDVASFFRMEKELMRPDDVFLKGESEFIEVVRSRGYRAIVADRLYGRALRHTSVRVLAPLPHFALSGEVYAPATEADFLRGMAEVIEV